jgi:hypothetical protein
MLAPVTAQTWGASPKPERPSLSMTSTRRESADVARRRAVTKGV